MLRVIAVDDEKRALNRFERIMKEDERVQVVGKFTTGEAALEFVKTEPVDVAFLDIEMPCMSGLEMAERLNREEPGIEVVFVTTYDQYSLKAFQTHAIGYVLKPFGIEEMEEQIDNVLRKLKYRQKKNRAETLVIQCFGQFNCRPAGNGGDAFRWRTAKAEELFALLIHYQGKPTPKEIIIDALWPEAEPMSAANNFRVTCTYLRNTFAEKGFNDILLRDRDNYMLSLKKLHCDTLDFTRVVNQNSVDDAGISAWEEASALYKAPYLENKPYEWAWQSRAWYEKEFEKLQNRLADFYIKKGNQGKACEAIARVLEQNPMAEEAVQRLITLKLQSGDTVSGIRIYYEYKERLFKEMGVPPSPNLQKLME